MVSFYDGKKLKILGMIRSVTRERGGVENYEKKIVRCHNVNSHLFDGNQLIFHRMNTGSE